jgi:TolB protein
VKKTIVLIVTFVTLFIAGNVMSQDDDFIPNYTIDTIRAGDVQPTQVGVDEMKYIGTDSITSDDSLVMNYISRIVQYDVDFQADFELVRVDSFFVKMYEIKEVDLLAWQRLGADYLVKLEAEFPSDKIRVRWRLIDTIRQQKITNGIITQPKKEWRVLGHEIANNIVRALTGEPGIFLTKICYIKKIGDAKEVFMSDFDGANEIQLTRTGTINLSPVFNPNMDEVYFTSYMEGDPKLFKVNINSKKTNKVADYKGLAAAPAISPDGNKIACVLSKDGNSEIYVMDLNGRIIKRLTRHRAIDSAPTWSPDGRMIAFSSDRSGSPQIYLMDSDGLNVRRLTYESRYNDSPIWSARGDRITFVSRTKYGRFDLASIDTTGLDYRILTEIGMNENPHFAPDGKHIVFSSTRLSSGDIFTMDITGRNQRRITRRGNCTNPNWGYLK